MQNYHRLYSVVSQERYDKLVNLQSSGGAQSIKDDAESDVALNDQELGVVFTPIKKSRNTSANSNGNDTEPESNTTTDTGKIDCSQAKIKSHASLSQPIIPLWPFASDALSL